jgi:excisionase family DNA binding protein
MNKAYWTINELSEYCSVAVNTLYKWVGANKIPYVKVNGCIRFNIERTKKFLESKEVRVKHLH